MKTMKSRIRKTLFLALSAVAAISIGAGIGSIYANAATNDATKLESMKTGGACIRLSGNWGIRFQTTLDKTDYDDLTANGSGLVTGILAIPADMLEDKELLTLSNTDAANAVTYDGTVNEWAQSKDDENLMEAYAYLDGNDIPELSYTRNISFRGYYTYNGNTVYTDVNNRSMTYVAQAALEHDEKTTNENAEEKDKVLDGAAEIKAQSFVKDYTVAYVDGVTGKLISTDTVSASGAVAENKVSENPNDPTLFGGEFSGWTSQNVEWKGTEELLTGDTVVKANYTAATTLDFSTATEVPEYLVVNTNASGQDKGIAKIDETNPSLYAAKWSNDTFTISYLKPMTLNEGDKLFIEVNAPSERWFKMNLKAMDDTDVATEIFHYYTAQDSVKDFLTVTYEAPAGGITFQTLEFVHEQAASLDFYVKSVRIERANQLSEYDYYNVDFANEDTLPSGVISSNGSRQYALDGEEDALWVCATHKEDESNSFFLKYPNINLGVGSTITITMKAATTAANGGGIYMNGKSKWIKNFSKNTGNYETLTYTIDAQTGATVLSKLYFWGYTKDVAYDLYIKSVVITPKNVLMSGTSLDFDTMGNGEAAYWAGAFSCSTTGSSIQTVKDTVNGQEKTVLLAKGVNKNQGLIVGTDIQLAAGATVTITVKVYSEDGAYGNVNGGVYINGTTDWRANFSAQGSWVTATFTVNDVTELSSIHIFQYDPNKNYDIYVASIVIS